MSLAIYDKQEGDVLEIKGLDSRLKIISPLAKYVKGKQNCLIINPGLLSDELFKEKIFQKFYSYDTWTKGDMGSYSLKNILEKQYPIVLLDNTGKNHLSDIDLNLISSIKLAGKELYSVESFFEHVTGRIPLINLSKHWIVNNDLFFVNNHWKFFLLKRAIDIFISLLILPISLLLILIGMMLMKLTSKGPVLFKQNRIGKNGNVFTLYKIRTMNHSPKGYDQYTVKNDERVTPIGKFLRLTKIDELPQLFNILKGDMSLIGPRPEKDDIVEKLVKDNPYYHLRHTIRPGISGWAQVNNPTATPDQNLEKLEYDLYYLKNMSIFLDLFVLYKTAKVVLTLNSL